MSDHLRLAKEYKRKRAHGEADHERCIEIILELKKELSFRQVGDLLGMNGQAIAYYLKRYGKEK